MKQNYASCTQFFIGNSIRLKGNRVEKGEEITDFFQFLILSR